MAHYYYVAPIMEQRLDLIMPLIIVCIWFAWIMIDIIYKKLQRWTVEIRAEISDILLKQYNIGAMLVVSSFNLIEYLD